MKPRIPGSVLVTVPLVVALVVLAVALPLVTRHDRRMVAEATAPTTAASASVTPSVQPREPVTSSSAPSAPAATARPATAGHHRVRPAPTPTPGPARHRQHRPSAAPAAVEPTCVPQDRVQQLRVVTFNIHSARDADSGDRVRIGTIGDELASWDPDVVLLQEVDRGRAWSDRIDMPAVLAARLGMHQAFGANVVRSASNEYGTAILSRYPITTWHNTLLPAPPGTQQRGLLHAVLDVDGVEMSVYDTHLEATSRPARERQVHAIMPLLRADDRPKLLGGDLNSAPGSEVVTSARSLLRDTWGEVGAGAGLTAPAGHPRVRIDYLLYGDGGGTSLRAQAVVLQRSTVSDHLAVRADYQLTTVGPEVCLPGVPAGGSD